MTKRTAIMLSLLMVVTLFGERKKSVIQNRENRNWTRLLIQYGNTDGYNSYEIRGSIGEDSRFRSKLEYPHNNAFYGFFFQWRKMRDNRRDFYIDGSVCLNINYPSAPMMDSDWYTDPPYYDDYLFSYTESETRPEMMEIDATLGIEMYRQKDFTIFGETGFLFYGYQYDMYSLDGWQHDVLWGSGYQDTFSLYTDTLVLKYDVKYYGLYVGGRAEFSPGQVLTLGGSARISPVMLAEDWDDHVLRNKEAYSTIKGGLYMGASADIMLETPTDLISAFFYARVFGESFSYEGYQSQRWYGDDPASEYDDTGYETHGIPTTLKYNRAGFGAGVGLSF